MLDHFFKKEFLIFLIIGGINTLSGVVFAYFYSLFCDANFAFILGYLTGLIISYSLNSFFNFKQSLRFKKFIKFVISYIPNFVIQNIVVYIVYNVIHFDKLFAYLCAAIIGLPITFILIKLFAFNEKKIL